MADDKRADAWKEAEALLNKGKTEGALEVLRDADADGAHATTLKLAGQAVYMKAGKSGSKAEYRQAAKLLRDSVRKNPRDKQANSLYNQLRNEMQDKGVSETVIPRMITDGGTPTPAGIFALLATILLVIAGIQAASSQNAADLPTEAIMVVSWTDNSGVEHSESLIIELYPDEAPVHVENFALLAQEGKYDGVLFHRVIDEFMIQGGDFTQNSGTGGHAAKFFGYCDGTAANSASDCSVTSYTIPDEADNGIKHAPYVLSMAKTSAANTGGSQFFIVDKDSTPSHLDGVHTVFGKVIDGKTYVEAISQVNTMSQDKPVHDVTIVSVTIPDEGSSTPWWQFW
jgi:cyclophilin family peptidyl-prolyl cis-trans isomerase